MNALCVFFLSIYQFARFICCIPWFALKAMKQRQWNALSRADAERVDSLRNPWRHLEK